MGGAAGHMRHPYDLDCVKSGEDMISLFNRLKTLSIISPESINVKIDGINISFKYTNGQFAVDRGSLNPLDIEGVTIKNLSKRYGEGHGMIPAITSLLEILNESISSILPEIEKLGLVLNEHFFLNTEFVAGKTNVSSYGQNIIAIHGVNGFYQKTKKPTKAELKKNPFAKEVVVRNGFPQIPGERSKLSKEVDFCEKTMAILVKKLDLFARRKGFRVYGPVEVTALDSDFNAADSLNEPLTINTKSIKYKSLQGKPIRDWLLSIKRKPSDYNGSDYTNMFNDLSGRRINPYYRNHYLDILHGSYLESLVAPKDIDTLIQGFVLVHSCRILGREFLKTLTSELGDLGDDKASHEGVVARHPMFGSHPFKITGDFIEKVFSGEISKKI